MKKRKVIILGLDGGTWKLLDSIMDEGVMPNLKKVVENGTSGVLQSTLPPYTAPAWVSCTTGVNPGKHGVFGFTRKKNGMNTGEFTDSRLIQFPRIWNFINSAGRTAGVINVPITYPAEPLDGFMVPCFFTPLGKQNYTYPICLYNDILVPLQYVINVRLSGLQLTAEKSIVQAIYDIKNMAQRRYDVMQALKNKYNPDFLMVVFTSLDKVQHILWKFIDRHEPMSQTPIALKLRPLFLSLYAQIDQFIGKTIDSLDADTTLYLVSDHGFGPQNKVFFINKWLARNGFLKLKYLKLMLHAIRSKYLANREFFPRNVDIIKHPIYDHIDFNKSFFVGSDQYEHGIYATRNSSNCDYHAKVTQLKKILIKAIDEATQKPLFEDVYSKNELYRGDGIENAPDIILKMRDYSINILRGYPIKGRMLKTISSPEGCHDPKGIFAAYGEDINSGIKVDASIMDVAPTVLYNMGIAVHKDMDGAVLEKIFKTDFKQNMDIAYSAYGNIFNTAAAQRQNYTQSEKEDVANKLRDLGYFD